MATAATASNKGRLLSSTNGSSSMDKSSSDSSTSQQLRPRRRASLLDELTPPTTTTAASSTEPSSSSWAYQSQSPFNNSLPANFGTTTTFEESSDYYSSPRVHNTNKPISWGVASNSKPSTTTITTTPSSFVVSSPSAAAAARPKLLKNVSMRHSFMIGRRCSAGEADSLRKNNTRQDSFRRLSLQNNNTTAEKELLPDASVSDYQEVFQQMKLQNPTASLGALQQKTMKRMSELKIEKEEMEKMNMERLRELENRNHHTTNVNNNNGGRMTLLGSLFSHNTANGRKPLLIRPRIGSDNMDGSGLGSDRNTNNNNNPTNNNNTPKAPYDVDDSFRSENSIDDETTLPRPNVLSRATILISRSRAASSSNNNQDSSGGGGAAAATSSSGGGLLLSHSRRSTIETNLSEADASADHNTSSNGILGGGGGGLGLGVAPIIQSSQLLIMGEDQKGNFAPRKSVGDLTAMMAGYNQSSDDDDNDIMSDDRSGPKSLCSEMSGLYISGEESIGIGSYANCETTQQQQYLDGPHKQVEILQTHFQQLDTSQRSNSCYSSNRHSVLSDSMTEGSYTGSLIVGFGKRKNNNSDASPLSQSKSLLKDEDESRGFAADFSAWDNR